MQDQKLPKYIANRAVNEVVSAKPASFQEQAEALREVSRQLLLAANQAERSALEGQP